MKKNESSTLHNIIVTSSQENLQKQDKVNSLPTQAPIGEPQQNIVQSSPDEFDAVAKAEIFRIPDFMITEKFHTIFWSILLCMGGILTVVSTMRLIILYKSI